MLCESVTFMLFLEVSMLLGSHQVPLHSQIRHLSKVDGSGSSKALFISREKDYSKIAETVNVHLYTTDSREMSDDSAQKLPELRLAGNATHARSPFFPF
jgi:hypothetical protein